jgi:Domain of unknown function (DUF4184)
VPFTAAHPAAILPLVRRGRWVTAALVAGSIAPDLPSFLPLGVGHQHTHLWTSIIWPDGAIALGVLLAWWALLRPGLAPLWPAAEARASVPGWRPGLVAARRPAVFAWCLWLMASVLVGLVTHLAWDSFTHFDGDVVLHWPQLREQIRGHALYDWLQAFSSVGGMLVVGIYLAVQWRRTPPARAVSGAAESRPLSRLARVVVVVAILLVTLITAAVAFYLAQRSFSGRYALLSRTLKPSGGAFIIAIAAWSLAHLLWGGHRPDGVPTHPHSREPADVP